MRTPPTGPKTSSRPYPLLAVLAAALLGACTAADGRTVAPDAGGGTSEGAVSAPAPSRPDTVPPDAIEVGDELYQVPIGRDDDGCQMYRMHSPSKMVVQAIFYRARDGGFTMDKTEAACTQRE